MIRIRILNFTRLSRLTKEKIKTVVFWTMELIWNNSSSDLLTDNLRKNNFLRCDEENRYLKQGSPTNVFTFSTAALLMAMRGG